MVYLSVWTCAALYYCSLCRLWKCGCWRRWPTADQLPLEWGWPSQWTPSQRGRSLRRKYSAQHRKNFGTSWTAIITSSINPNLKSFFFTMHQVHLLFLWAMLIDWLIQTIPTFRVGCIVPSFGVHQLVNCNLFLKCIPGESIKWIYPTWALYHSNWVGFNFHKLQP